MEYIRLSKKEIQHVLYEISYSNPDRRNRRG